MGRGRCVRHVHEVVGRLCFPLTVSAFSTSSESVGRSSIWDEVERPDSGRGALASSPVLDIVAFNLFDRLNPSAANMTAVSLIAVGPPLGTFSSDELLELVFR